MNSRNNSVIKSSQSYGATLNSNKNDNLFGGGSVLSPSNKNHGKETSALTAPKGALRANS